jgi:alpha-tubulin suppressor-like RCC1 family protein
MIARSRNGGPRLRLALSVGAQVSLALLVGCQNESTGPTSTDPPASAPVLTLAAAPSPLYLHGSGGTANPPVLFLDGSAPTAATAKYKDSPSVKFSGGNTWAAVGTWTAAPSEVSGSVTAAGPADVWLGLKNSDDVGTRFDLRVEAYKNGDLVGSGEFRCIHGLVRNANQATEVTVGFDSFAPAVFDGTSDVFSLKVLARIGTTPAGAFCGGHSNATGVRLYFDATSRVASVGLTLGPTSVEFASVSGGANHTCAVTTTGAAYCWGSNDRGQLGDDTRIDRSVPTAVSGGLTFASVGAGYNHSCGVTTGGAAYCWGNNDVGGLGDGSYTDSNVPVAVSGGLTFASVGTGLSYSCGLTTAGAAYCWGYNGAGALGNGSGFSGNSNVPLAVAGGHTFSSLTTGFSHTCGVTAIGDAYCWGNNDYGDLGDGTTTHRNVPSLVLGGPYASVLAGHFHSCGLTIVGSAFCWGFNGFGQLGNGTTTDNSTPNPVPVPVLGGLTFASATVGLNHSCGVTTAAAAYCWGGNYDGQLGDSTNTARTVPVAVSGGLTFGSLDGGDDHTCGVTTAGAAYCWGLNNAGQLGNGTNGFSTNRKFPVAVNSPS